MLLVSLITAVQRRLPNFGQATLELMCRRPGPVAGWPPTFAGLAEGLNEALSARDALVLEHAHKRSENEITRPWGCLAGP